MLNLHSDRFCGAFISAYAATLAEAEVKLYVALFGFPEDRPVWTINRAQKALGAFLHVSHWMVSLPVTRQIGLAGFPAYPCWRDFFPAFLLRTHSGLTPS